jgi:hypothetical protein
MEEMMEETLDGLDDEELEEEADAEVDKVLFELTDGKLGQAGRVGTDLPVSAVVIIPLTPPRRTPRTKRNPRPRCSACSARCRSSSMGNCWRELDTRSAQRGAFMVARFAWP